MTEQTKVIQRPGARREADAIVAEKVMGWKRCSKYKCRKPGFTGELGVWMSAQPLFTTDIAAAWEVVEHVAADGWAFCVWDDGLVEVFHREDNHAYMRTVADTAPEAIAIAALRAVGYTVEV